MENRFGRTDRQEAIWSQIEGNWTQVKGKVKEKWGELTDDDLRYMAGRRDRIVGTILDLYGETKWQEAEIERELREIGRL